MVKSQYCEVLTAPDIEGPKYVPNADLDYTLAPPNEISDNHKGVILTGQIFDQNCYGIKGATVEVWFAGPGAIEAEYTKRPQKLWYRGKAETDRDGYYKFVGIYPGSYKDRPIPHVHFMVTSPGSNGRSLTTQMYFKDNIPVKYESYRQSKKTQFAEVRWVGAGNGLPNGGRILTFDINM